MHMRHSCGGAVVLTVFERTIRAAVAQCALAKADALDAVIITAVAIATAAVVAVAGGVSSGVNGCGSAIDLAIVAAAAAAVVGGDGSGVCGCAN